MKLETRVFRTVAKPVGSNSFRSGFVRLNFPSYEAGEAPVAVKHGAVEYRIVDGRLYLPIFHSDNRYMPPDQAMVNRMLTPLLSHAAYRDLLARTGDGGKPGPDLTETDRGAHLRQTALSYALIDGVHHVPVPGPMLNVSVNYKRVGYANDGGNAMTAKVNWVEQEHSQVMLGALFPMDRIEEGLEFASSIECEDRTEIPSRSRLKAMIDVLIPFETDDLKEMQLWLHAHSKLHAATYAPIHDFGRNAIAATLALRKDLGRRCGGVDPFLDTMWSSSHQKEMAAFLRHYDVAGLEDTLGPVVDALADMKIREGTPANYYNARFDQSFLAFLAPRYRPPGHEPIDDEALDLLTEASVGPKP